MLFCFLFFFLYDTRTTKKEGLKYISDLDGSGIVIFVFLFFFVLFFFLVEELLSY